MSRLDFGQFESDIDLYFHDKGLLRQAFVHRSYLNEMVDDDELADNERLEFLGDAILSFITSELLYARFPHHQEGELTRLRSTLVRRETLARLALQLRLGEYLMLGRGEEEGGGRTRQATLCATFEAVLGAIYVDQGLEAVKGFALSLLEPELERVSDTALDKDAKSRLQEFSQQTFGYTPRYRTVVAVGPDHDKRFTLIVLVAKHPVGRGYGRSKQDAAQSAAAEALYRLGQPAPEYEKRDFLPGDDELVDIELVDLEMLTKLAEDRTISG